MSGIDEFLALDSERKKATARVKFVHTHMEKEWKRNGEKYGGRYDFWDAKQDELCPIADRLNRECYETMKEIEQDAEERMTPSELALSRKRHELFDEMCTNRIHKLFGAIVAGTTRRSVDKKEREFENNM